jgi:hypothetical protein
LFIIEGKFTVFSGGGQILDFGRARERARLFLAGFKEKLGTHAGTFTFTGER